MTKNVETLYLANPLERINSETSASSQDGAIGTGFSLLTKTTEKPDKIYETQFSEIGHQAAQDRGF